MILSRIRVAGLVMVLLVGTGLSVGAQTLVDIKLPPGAIIAFDLDTCPDGWEEFRYAEGRFLRGKDHDEVPRQLGGSDRHAHIATTGTGGSGRGVDNDNDVTVSDHGHRHTVETDERDNVPEYVAVLFCRLK